MSIPLACLSFAAGINVGITRTSLAKSIILCFLAGERNAMSGSLAGSLVSLFVTSYMPFIKSQVAHVDLEHSIYSDLDMDGIDVESSDDEHEEDAFVPAEQLPLAV